MNDAGKEAIRQELGGYILGTASEWMNLVDLPVDPATGRVTPEEGWRYRTSWEFPTDDAAIVTVTEIDHTVVARFGVTISVDPLPDLPPIGPECDPALMHEQDDWINAGATSCLACKGRGCGGCQGVGMWREPDQAPEMMTPRALRPALPEWIPATLAHVLAGDHIRAGQTEADVTSSSAGEWHANNRDPYRPTRWDHVELILDLTANPGKRQYPPDMECEILCSPERAATLVIQLQFSGSQIISSDVN